MELNCKALSENLGTMQGVNPLCSLPNDLYKKKNFLINSWFAIGHFDHDDVKLSYMYHIMFFESPALGTDPFVYSILSITDENTQENQSQETLFPVAQCQADGDRFYVKVPNGEMSGTMDDMVVKADFGWGSVDTKLHMVGYPIYNAGTGTFSLLDMQVYQLSIPNIEAEGTVTFHGKTYNVHGRSWLDCQWENADHPLIGKWSWFDINLSNNELVSLWGFVDLLQEREHAWCTVLHPDGTQTVTEVEPLSKGESNYWDSDGEMYYPTHWNIRIPEYNACLEVIPAGYKQEVISDLDPKYEAACAVKGTWNGEAVDGYCYAELVGGWRDI